MKIELVGLIEADGLEMRIDVETGKQVLLIPSDHVFLPQSREVAMIEADGMWIEEDSQTNKETLFIPLDKLRELYRSLNAMMIGRN